MKWSRIIFPSVPIWHKSRICWIKRSNAFRPFKDWLCTQIRAGSTNTLSTEKNWRNMESSNLCPERATAMTTALWKHSSEDWRTRCSMDLRRTILPLRSFPKLLLIISTITITAGFKLKQNGCLPLNSGKHPCLNLNYSFFIQCPENWVHIMVYCLGNGVFLYAKGTTKVQRNAEGRNH